MGPEEYLDVKGLRAEAGNAIVRERAPGLALTLSLEQLTAQLSQLSPLGILERGYAIVTNESGAIVTENQVAPAASAIHVRLAKGRLDAKVTVSLP